MKNWETFIFLCAVGFIFVGLIACLVPALLVVILVIWLSCWIYNLCTKNTTNVSINKTIDSNKYNELKNDNTTNGENYNYFNNPEKENLNEIDNFEQASIETIYQASDLRIIRDELNSIDLSVISKKRLLYRLEKLDTKVPNQDFFDYNALMEQLSYEEFIKALQQAKDILNGLDLNNKTTITHKELLDSIDKTGITSLMQEIEEEGMFEDAEEEDFEEDDENGILGLAAIAGAILGDETAKQQRIRQKREILAKLQREHGFAKGYAPNWDPSESLYSKYTDEEKYLDAKIEEVKHKNLSYDMYLTEDEKRMFKDDISPGYW